MKADESQYNVSVLNTERVMTVHLQELRSYTQSLLIHKIAIRKLLSYCRKETGAYECVKLNETEIIQWMIEDAKAICTKYVAIRVMAVNRYIKALCHHGLLPDNPLENLKASLGNQSWISIAELVKSPNPGKILNNRDTNSVGREVLNEHILSYIKLKQSVGNIYKKNQRVLFDFDHFISMRTNPTLYANTIEPKHIRQWLKHMKCSFNEQRRKIYILKRFFDYLICIGDWSNNSADIVLEEFGSPNATKFRPLIFTKPQIAQVLKVAKSLPKTRTFPLRAHVCYTIIAMLYALGLRHSEARNLRICDVNLDQFTLAIVQTKFHKSRVVPFGPKMAQAIEAYLAVRRKLFSPVKDHDPLFITFRLVPISGNTLWKTFQDIIDIAGIESFPCYSRPRLHDLRHTFAVHRLLRWYQEGVDVQSKLLQLSTFMGHSEIHSTQIYLTMTNELLDEANMRFYDKFGIFF